MEINKTYQGDSLEILKTFPDNFIDCCVTSPPYWNLRDYGIGGQLGLESTPEEYVSKLVEVFAEVRRVMKPTATLWLNLGDSYAGSGRGLDADGTWNPGNGESKQGTHRYNKSQINRKVNGNSLNKKSIEDGVIGNAWVKPPRGYKPKDLIGIPWTLAKALQAPQYLGKIKSESERTWMAAMIDGEGTINAFDHQRKDDGRIRTGINICVTNSNLKLLDRCFEIYSTSRSEHNHHSEGHFGNLPTYRWIVHGTENKILFIKEIYPYLIAKKKQALLAYNMLLFSLDAKRLGKTPMKDSVNAKRQLLAELISKANKQEEIDIPDWCLPVDCKSLYVDGWYLRQDIIWHKPNPMPESVTDRCTKAHEYIFLLSKSARYYYDAEAISEKSIWFEKDSRSANGRTPHKSGKSTMTESQYAINGVGYSENGMRNKRSVWSVITNGFPEAHFATFPPELIVDCIKAGCPPDGIVLDPFNGSGTTRVVAEKLGRNSIGIELNPKYIQIENRRRKKELGMFEKVAS